MEELIDKNTYAIEVELDKLKKILKQDYINKKMIDNQINNLKREVRKLEFLIKIKMEEIMEELYNNVCKCIEEHNSIADNLYNGILLEVYNEYSYTYKEDNELLTLNDLEDIADNVIGNDYFGEILTECIRQEMEKKIR